MARAARRRKTPQADFDRFARNLHLSMGGIVDRKSYDLAFKEFMEGSPAPPGLKEGGFASYQKLTGIPQQLGPMEAQPPPEPTRAARRRLQVGPRPASEFTRLGTQKTRTGKTRTVYTRTDRIVIRGKERTVSRDRLGRYTKTVK